MANRLAHETSPYLLQHAENPVDWRPWGPEALESAKAEGKPIFLSIGYSACHWCHVMERESFEDPEIAKELNTRFVCIKVDREERPDLDQVYMQAVQIMTGRGGWPMSVFLTPDLQPFFGGTYWPPRRRMNMPGFLEVIQAVEDAWQNRREAAISQAGELTRRLQAISSMGDVSQPGAPSASVLDGAFAALEQSFDFRHGGFGHAPKFPHAMDLQVLLRHWRRTGESRALEMVVRNLDGMADGGIYDHLGGGFARYSVDAEWLVPHFEKMLYDNALLAEVYLDAFLATGHSRYETIVRETLDYVLREMTDASGGFHSTEDADSEGEEGKFYVWSPEEVNAVLGEERGARFCQAYDVTTRGNFEGANILNRLRASQLSESIPTEELADQLREDRETLRLHRERRIRPGKDDKILTSWNGLMIHALSRAAAGLDCDEYRRAAESAVDFLWKELRTPEGRLLHSYREGQAKFPAYLEDYAYLANGLVSLYEATFEERFVEMACDLADQILERFDDATGGFFFTASDHETMIVRSKDLHDSSVPSSNAMAATVLLRLARLVGEGRYEEAAEKAIVSAIGQMEKTPQASGQMLIALDMFLGPFREVVLVGPGDSEDMRKMLRAARSHFSPNQVVALRDPGDGSSMSSRLEAAFSGRMDRPESVLFLCERFSCQAPLTGGAAIEALRQTERGS